MESVFSINMLKIMAETTRFVSHLMKTMLRITFVMKGQPGNKADPAVKALNKSLCINPLTYPFALRHESTDPLLGRLLQEYVSESEKQKMRRERD